MDILRNPLDISSDVSLSLPEKHLTSFLPDFFKNHPEESFCFLNVGALRDRVELLYETFLPQRSDRRIAYAVKANPHPAILKTLIQAGLSSFDCASPLEIEAIRDINPNAEIYFNHPIKTRQAIRSAAQDGVRHFTLQSEQELLKILDELHPSQGHSEFELVARLQTPNDEAKVNLSSKFGAEESVVSRLIHNVKKQKEGFVPGISMHVGSQNTDISQFHRGIETMTKIARHQGGVQTLNVGGGVPVNYGETNEIEVGDYIQKISKYLEQHLKGVLKGDNTKIIIELGRAMVAECIDLIIPIISREERNGVPCLYMQDGVFTSFSDSAVHQWNYTFSTIGRNERRLSRDKIHFTLFGRTCDSGDVIKRVLLPANMQEGDFLHLSNAGAYMDSQSTQFNGFLPPQYVVYNS